MNATIGETGAHHQPRVEDDTLVRGRGRYVDDAATPGQAYAYFVRSPHAFARIKSIDTAAAKSAPGVLAVLTGADTDAAGIADVSHHPPMVGRNGAKLVVPKRPSLARDRVMHVGEPIALVVAQTLAQAQDAGELVAVEYEDLTPVIDAREAMKPGAPLLWPEAAGNVALDWPGPVADDGSNAREIERIMTSAAHVARVSVVNQRLIVATMEPRGATASYDAANDAYTLRSCSQGATALQTQLAAAMGLNRDKLRVLTDDVGGAFGLKTSGYPEYPALLIAARKIGKPVHWMATRSESFLSDNQARDNITDAELALDDKGKFLALRVRHIANLGAYIAGPGAHIQTNNFARCFPGMYDIPRIQVETRCAFTNTVPTGPYRGAGRPEANYLVERLVDEAARVTGIAPVKIRRRNLIPKRAMPYKTAVGTVFDSGDFAPMLDQVLTLADYAGFGKRRREAAKRGKKRGIGLSCFLEHAGGMPTEGAALSFPGDGTLLITLGVHSTGQGHATVYPQIAAQRLGIAADKIRHAAGDSRLEVASGASASVGSRSTITAGTALVTGVDAMIEKGRKIASTVLEAAEGDIVYRAGMFTVAGTDRRISLFDLAAQAVELKKRGAIAEDLDTKSVTQAPQTFPNGCHIAEVEIDPDTGTVVVVGYAGVDDGGNILNHMIVEGQVQGGIAQGLGQVLMENVVYEPGSGQLSTGSFMDYAMPRADNMPNIVTGDYPVPATTNPLGVKGVGEAGTTGSLAAIMNAVADALGPAGAKLDMPVTAEKIWRACQQAKV